jgi:predicted patatin/cPLA2 family phospholipase
MVEICRQSCIDGNDARKLERKYFEELGATLNVEVPSRTPQEWYTDNIDHRYEYNKKYYEDNREECLQQKKKYYEEHKEEIKEKKKQYYQLQTTKSSTNLDNV